MNVNKKLVINDSKIKGYWWFISLFTIYILISLDHLTEKKKEDTKLGLKLDTCYSKPRYKYRQQGVEATIYQASQFGIIILLVDNQDALYLNKLWKMRLNKYWIVGQQYYLSLIKGLAYNYLMMDFPKSRVKYSIFSTNHI